MKDRTDMENINKYCPSSANNLLKFNYLTKNSIYFKE